MAVLACLLDVERHVVGGDSTLPRPLNRPCKFNSNKLVPRQHNLRQAASDLDLDHDLSKSMVTFGADAQHLCQMS